MEHAFEQCLIVQFKCAFFLLLMQGVCHLLSDIESYCKEVLSGSPSFDLTCLDGCNDETERLSEYENMDLDNIACQEVIEEAETSKSAGKGIPFHLHVPEVLDELVEGIFTGGVFVHSVVVALCKDVQRPMIFFTRTIFIHGALPPVLS